MSCKATYASQVFATCSGHHFKKLNSVLERNISHVKSLWGVPFHAQHSRQNGKLTARALKYHKRSPHESVSSSYPQCSKTPLRQQSQTVLRFTPEKNAAQRTDPADWCRANEAWGRQQHPAAAPLLPSVRRRHMCFSLQLCAGITIIKTKSGDMDIRLTRRTNTFARCLPF